MELHAKNGALGQGIAEAQGHVDQLRVIECGILAIKVVGHVVGIPAVGNAALALDFGGHHFEVRAHVEVAFVNNIAFDLRIGLEGANTDTGQVARIERRYFDGGIHAQVGRESIEAFTVGKFVERFEPSVMEHACRLR